MMFVRLKSIQLSSSPPHPWIGSTSLTYKISSGAELLCAIASKESKRHQIINRYFLSFLCACAFFFPSSGLDLLSESRPITGQLCKEVCGKHFESDCEKKKKK